MVDRIVRVVPLQPHCLAFGGFEVQMIDAMRSVGDLGVNIAPLDFWGRDVGFDVLHLWGLDLQHHNTITWGHRVGKKIIISALVAYPGFSSWIRNFASNLTWMGQRRKSMLSYVDAITVVNEEQKDFLVHTVGFEAEKVFVIPNIVDDIFFSGLEDPDVLNLDIVDYVICVGNICRRKNQLKLLQACSEIGVPLLLVGETLAGEEDYGRAILDALSNCRDARWIVGLPPGSAKLASAYAKSAVFALPSYSEQQPISALEASASGKPIILADRPYGKQELLAHSALVNPDSVDAIGKTLRMVLGNTHRYRPRLNDFSQCRRSAVGKSYIAAYDSLFR